MRQDIGVYRLHSKGLIQEGYFDWDTKRIGPYVVEPEYGYIEEYHSGVAELPLRDFYKLLAEDDNILAALSINKTFIACLFKGGSVYYYYYEDRLFHLSKVNWTYGENIDVVPIGFERTRYKCQSVFLMPAQLLYSPSRMSIYYNRTWTPLHRKPMIGHEISNALYTDLIHQNKEYVYYSEGGDLVWKV